MPVAHGKPSLPARLTILRAKNLAAIPTIIHGFSTRPGGFSTAYGKRSLNLGFTEHDLRSRVEKNRAAFFRALGGGRAWKLVTLRQLHSDLIHPVTAPPDAPLPGDGLVTNVPGLLLAVMAADCFPILLADPKRKAVGVFHAGWRGTLRRIAEKGVGEMRRCFGSRPEDLRAAIGPGIQKCCFEIGEEVRDQFHSQFAGAADLFHEVRDSDPVREKYPLLFLTARAPGHSDLPYKLFLDLAEANRRQLISAGVRAKNIEALSECTSCRTDLLFSHRKEQGKTGRMMGAIGLRP